MCDSLQPCRLLISRLLCPWDSSGKKTGVGCHFLLQGIFLTLGSKLCLLRFLRCRQILTAELLGKPLSAYCKVMRQVWRNKAVRDKKADSCSLCKYITILTLYYSCNSRVSDSCCLVRLLSCVRLFATPWTIAYQAPPSMGFSRQEYWSGLPFPSPGDLPNPGIEPRSPALRAGALPSEPQGSPCC